MGAFSARRQVFLIERDSGFDEDVNLIAKPVLSRELEKCGVQVQLARNSWARGDMASACKQDRARVQSRNDLDNSAPVPLQAPRTDWRAEARCR
jgi:hypothetical protein